MRTAASARASAVEPRLSALLGELGNDVVRIRPLGRPTEQRPHATYAARRVEGHVSMSFRAFLALSRAFLSSS
jgi:hypothetical protein